MKILYVDKYSFQTQTRISLINDRLGHEVELAETLDDVQKMFKKDLYEIVIADHGTEEAMAALDYIAGIDIEQRILTISAAVEHSVSQGCDYCVQNYRRRRLNNPTPIKNILRMIEGFDLYSCDHYDGIHKKR